jgi:soluble lytic murein transglycosylase-like protein
MVNKEIKEYVNAIIKPAWAAWCVLFSFLVIVGLVLAYASTMPGSATDAIHFPSFHLNSLNGQAKEKSRLAILQWMKENSDMPDQVLAKIYTAASATGNRDLILAICLVESNFNPHVESDKGAVGLMGIMPGVWVEELKERGIITEKEDLYKISSNISAGAYVLATYLAETNDLRQALIKYVGGASWYATRVLQARNKIELAQHSEEQLALAVIQE